ncbi:unnamed protein product (macronuclear) [Paramecium tetraurelia]|uniref:Myb-like domain-containing protein n=1 Tax=Paramecium tetraurelia TaxID=5888 RepID=A0CD21_PARTE|nr:uncharacterized protein GSPATT00037473001 [Paramecium tetraurelia]CAK68688.1 unnamed protein product [Paramecium tetraurelia]|eukprot:XP_001436085.1 hypothetical protein (macronuclear) [Paramecium tetraurelia strain d4-2]
MKNHQQSQKNQMINFVDTYEEQKLELFEEELELFGLVSSPNTLIFSDQGLSTCVDQDSNLSTPQQQEIQKIKLPIQRRRPPKRIQYTYHKKKKRPAPKPIIHIKENGLKVCLVMEKPKSNAHPFSNVEDKRILELVLKIGPKFYKISKSFPGKSVSMVKNRYYKYLRYRWDQVMGSEYSHMNSLPEDQPCESQRSNDINYELDSDC